MHKYSSYMLTHIWTLNVYILDWLSKIVYAICEYPLKKALQNDANIKTMTIYVHIIYNKDKENYSNFYQITINIYGIHIFFSNFNILHDLKWRFTACKHHHPKII